MSDILSSFSDKNFHLLCDKLGRKDKDLRGILKKYGYPPLWSRPSSFSTLIHIILEQQVSLASALAAFNKLKEKIGSVTPEKLLALSDEEMRACYFSRQKTIYARHLAEVIVSGKLNLEELSILPDHLIREKLKQIKGIGDWTVDVYLLFALKRTDVFPVGDLAMINAFRDIKQLSKEISREAIIEMARPWQPYRSIGTMLLWHHYIQKRGIRT
ncbi:DNA-3-methyladenine glycosylase family protein [Terrimonas pollutisoli]|uniref:DNA-3-methyladenine glycosylase family protein n=1 Tax=Terrimonas pollutisoli TaxID=3034147 RepID=UPI0023ED14B0|nr:DNA-3-methyladenine glycosylase 2 family protein [Terrimonas sp. H1YJ31]